MRENILIDHYLPIYQFSERHESYVSATPGLLLNALTSPGIATDPWMRAFIKLREFPARALGKLGEDGTLNKKPPFGIDDFLLLGREADREVALGLLGRFWRQDYGLVSADSPSEFHAFNEIGVAKLVLNLSARIMDDGRTRLTTETRIFCNDKKSEVYMTLYWWMIRPVSGLIRRRLLARICNYATGDVNVK